MNIFQRARSPVMVRTAWIRAVHAGAVTVTALPVCVRTAVCPGTGACCVRKVGFLRDSTQIHL